MDKTEVPHLLHDQSQVLIVVHTFITKLSWRIDKPEQRVTFKTNSKNSQKVKKTRIINLKII